jgi:dienelactone hydrolase
MRLLPIALLLLALLAACSPANGETPPTAASTAPAVTLPPLPTAPGATATATASPSPAPDEAFGEPEPQPTTPATPAATAAPAGAAAPTLLPTPDPAALPADHPLYPYTIDGLRSRDYPGGTIQIRQLMAESATFSRYYVSYPSDGLTITGIMQVPHGAGPFPVAVMLHGYIDRHLYQAGADTWQAAGYLNQFGYLTIAPDYRSWGGSDQDTSLFHTGLVADALNLISSLPSLPQADPEKVVLWGHSMGGGVATKVLVIDDRPLAAVLYASNSPDDADLIARWGPGCRPGVPLVTNSDCNPGDFLAPSMPPDLMEAYFAGAADPAFLRHVAPLYFLDAVSVPVQIHIGAADGAELNGTPPEWSDTLYTALLAADKDVSFFSYPDEGHAFQRNAWAEMMARAVAMYDEVTGKAAAP